MAYFPAFLKLDGRKVLLVGGGRIATEKLQKLLDFTHDITIVAPRIDPQMEALIHTHRLTYRPRCYRPEDLEGIYMAIVAVDDLSLQQSIYETCRTRRILCNSVDSVEYCDFIFPSYTRKGDLTVAFSTSGASPSVAKYLRRAIEQTIPDSVADFLEEMKALRKSLPKGKERMAMLDRKAKAFIEKIFDKEL